MLSFIIESFSFESFDEEFNLNTATSERWLNRRKRMEEAMKAPRKESEFN